LVNFLADLVSKLSFNDVGLMVSRLVDHNAQVNETCSALLKGHAETALPQPTLLKSLAEKKRALMDAIKPAVQELIRLDSPLETATLEKLIVSPESFFSPNVIRANRCFIKGQLPRERVVREFGESALPLFNDLTTDKRFNPRPKPDEIVLGFKDDFETLVQADTALKPELREALTALYQKVQRSKGDTDPARQQRQTFARLSFLLELLRYYENQSTEAPDAVFAQRLPAAVEQFAVPDPDAALVEQTILRTEELLNFIVKPEHRHMVVNNIGKGGGTARTLKHVLNLRAETVVDLEHSLAEFVRHLVHSAPQPAPTVKALVEIVSLIPPDMQRLLIGSIMSSDRRQRDELTQLGRAVAKELGLKDLENAKTSAAMPPEMERRLAWEDVGARIRKREDAASIAAAIRERLHTRYDVDEVKESWLMLIEADPVSFIRIFCQLPYLPSGKTDPIAHAVMQVYVGRLLHEKYAATYNKIVTSLKTMHQANPQSPTLLNFMAMVKWADAEAAEKVSADVGLAAAA
ncbi:MAG: hypothetical protein MUC91_01275, partial [Verrucomicrobia bacterium]|nr:hypothetical protein [Verrucomicrobiota bacterium]